MATIKDTAATSALNEEQYINKLYDTNLGNQNKVLQDNFSNDNVLLDEAQKHTQLQTDQYVNRTDVEAQKADDNYGTGGLSAGAQAQVNLTQENAQRRNTSALQSAQQDADAEYQRQRQLLAKQYETEIRKAQADNDMQRAQALYEAAKQEEAKLLELQKQGALLMQQKGDSTILDQIADGVTLPRDTQGDTWDAVLKNEDSLNQIYDAELQSLLAQLGMDYEKAASDLAAKRTEQEKQTDESLTKAYVDSLRSQKNQNEMQGAYGRTSGTAAQGRLAGDVELQDTLTDIRRQQLDRDAQSGLEGVQLGADYGKQKFDAQQDVDQKRADALYGAAEQEEQTLLENQLFVGEQKAKNNDYEMLGLLYGLTPDQIDRLMGRGKYAYVPPAVSYTPSRKQQIAKEVAAATVVDSQGRPAENSAYWNAVKKSAYYK
jgi:hypothetical protein